MPPLKPELPTLIEQLNETNACGLLAPISALHFNSICFCFSLFCFHLFPLDFLQNGNSVSENLCADSADLKEAKAYIAAFPFFVAQAAQNFLPDMRLNFLLTSHQRGVCHSEILYFLLVDFLSVPDMQDLQFGGSALSAGFCLQNTC